VTGIPPCGAGPDEGASAAGGDDWQQARGWAEAVLREARLPITRPRLLVLTALRGRQRPVTAQNLHRDLDTRLHQRTTHGQHSPGAVRLPGLTTIYRVLATLAERGILHTFHPGGGAVTGYRLCAPISHHHLVCRSCGWVEEQPPGPVREWAAQLATTNGFAVEDYHAIGLCATCRPDPTQPHPLDSPTL
jgi:Fe2+ or Zn2+ uptake regulation protein